MSTARTWRGWRWLQARLVALMFAAAFLGSAAGSTVARDAEETAESESGASDSVAPLARTTGRKHRNPRADGSFYRRTTVHAVDPHLRVPPSSRARARPTKARSGLPRRAPPDDDDDSLARLA